MLPVSAIRGQELDFGDEGLIEESLADVAGLDIVTEGAVVVAISTSVDHDVDVSGTASVMAREDGLELCDPVRVCFLDTTEPGVVDVGSISGVAVSLSIHA